MKRIVCRAAGFVLAGLLGVTGLWAEDPWKAKSYKEWSEKEVQKVLNDSPWARSASVEATWIPHRPGENLPGGDPNTPRPSAGAVKETEVKFLARWTSARVMRQALARAAVLGKSASEADTERFVAAEPTEYAVAVLGQDLAPMAATGEKDLLAESYLSLKTSRSRLPASRVELQRSPDGKQVVAALFFFPKRTAAGEETLGASERAVELVCGTRDVVLKFTFDLSKMVGARGRDL